MPYDDATAPWLAADESTDCATTVTSRTCLRSASAWGTSCSPWRLGGRGRSSTRAGAALGLDPVRSRLRDGPIELASVIADGARGIQWNNDIVSRLPAGATVLATSPDDDPCRPSRFGERAWGLQFHAGGVAEVVATWVRSRRLRATETASSWRRRPLSSSPPRRAAPRLGGARAQVVPASWQRPVVAVGRDAWPDRTAGRPAGAARVRCRHPDSCCGLWSIAGRRSDHDLLVS